MDNKIMLKQRACGSAENGLLNISRKYRGFFRFGQILCLKGPFISLDTLQAAVSCLQRRHPFLRCRLQNNPAAPNTYLLVEDPTLCLKIREISRKCDDQHFDVLRQEWREREKDTPVIGEGLAEFWLLQDPDDHENTEASREVVFICEHSICDGISLSTITHELLLALGEEDKSMFNTSLDWPLPLESLIQRNVSWWNRFARLSKFISAATYQYLTLGRKTARIPYENVNFPLNDAHEHCSSESFSDSLTKEETQALFDRCHKEQISVTSAISAAILRAISTLVNDKNGYLAHMVAADLRRRYIPPVPDSFLSYQVAGVSTFYLAVNDVPSTSTDMWHLARKFGLHVKNGIDNGEMFTTGMITGKMYEKEAGPLSSTDNPSCGITSWGRLCFKEQYGQWKLERMKPIGNLVRSFTPMAIAFTVNGVLTIGHAGPVPLFSLNVLEQLQNNVMQHLRDMIVN